MTGEAITQETTVFKGESIEHTYTKPEGYTGPFFVFADISVKDGQAVFTTGGGNCLVKDLTTIGEGERVLLRVSISPCGTKGVVNFQRRKANGSPFMDPETARRYTIFSAITAEREYQKQKWSERYNDDEWRAIDWAKFILEYLPYAANFGCVVPLRHTDYDFRTQMIKVAALAVAALEAHDRKQEKEK
jgi:hypothetical protein